jgi:acetoin utilization deacetylase AcuC-like enzyme
LLRAHAPEHVAQVLDAHPDASGLRLDEDTVMSPASAEAAQRAAGAVIAAVDAVMQNACERAFCAVRPPGHHATARTPMGFCLFNNAAVAAMHALMHHRLKRVAIVDFDVHHGNGSQDIFQHESRVLYVSSHQAPLYPGTGAASDCGVGNIVNAPLPPGTGSQEFRQIWDGLLLPRLHDFRPQLVLVSAGFDAHRLDPLAQMQLDTEDYAWITERLVQLADAHARGRLVSTLEGGYDLTALAAGVNAHVQALLD